MARHTDSLRWMRQILRSEDGAVTVEFVVLLPFMIVFLGLIATASLYLGLASDVQQLAHELARSALSVADEDDWCDQIETQRAPPLATSLPLLDPARVRDESRAAARATIAANDAYPGFAVPDTDIVFGTAPTPDSFTPVTDQTSTNWVTAVQVFATAPVRLFLLELFMPAAVDAVRLGDALVLPDDLRRLTVDTPVHSLDLRVSDLVPCRA